MTMLASINGFKANFKATDPDAYALATGGSATTSALTPSAPATYVAPVVAATIPAAASPVQSAGGQIPIPVPIAPYSSGQVVGSVASPATSKPIDKKYIIIGSVVLLVLFFLIVRR